MNRIDSALTKHPTDWTESEAILLISATMIMILQTNLAPSKDYTLAATMMLASLCRFATPRANEESFYSWESLQPKLMRLIGTP